MKRIYYVNLTKSMYFEGTAIVEAESEDEARRIADESHVDQWNLFDKEIEVCDGEDAVTTDEE